MPPDIEDKVFEVFFTTKEHGTGLGLGIARRITEEHGGTILLENHPGVGAEFIIRLPKGKFLEYPSDFDMASSQDETSHHRGKIEPS